MQTADTAAHLPAATIRRPRPPSPYDIAIAQAQLRLNIQIAIEAGLRAEAARRDRSTSTQVLAGLYDGAEGIANIPVWGAKLVDDIANFDG